MSTLTATTTDDIGSSPFYIEIFDATTQTHLRPGASAKAAHHRPDRPVSASGSAPEA
jgi:hypothetical protein